MSPAAEARGWPWPGRPCLSWRGSAGGLRRHGARRAGLEGRPQVRLPRPTVGACWCPEDRGGSAGLHRDTGPRVFILTGGKGSR